MSCLSEPSPATLRSVPRQSTMASNAPEPAAAMAGPHPAVSFAFIEMPGSTTVLPPTFSCAMASPGRGQQSFEPSGHTAPEEPYTSPMAAVTDSAVGPTTRIREPTERGSAPPPFFSRTAPCRTPSAAASRFAAVPMSAAPKRSSAGGSASSGSNCPSRKRCASTRPAAAYTAGGAVSPCASASHRCDGEMVFEFWSMPALSAAAAAATREPFV